MIGNKKAIAALIASCLIAVSCSSSTSTGSEGTGSEGTASQDAGTEATATDAETPTPTEAGVRLVNAVDAAAIQTSPPDDLVILDVRTPEEFAEGHLEGAIMIDFYRDDFAEQLATLDPDVPYLLYCRSGNRSGQTAALLKGLGFSDVADVDGGVIKWGEAGLPLVIG